MNATAADDPTDISVIGTISEIEAAAALIPAPTRVIAIDGAGNDLKRGKLDFAPVLAALG